MAKVDTSKLKIRQLRGLSGITQADFMSAVGYKHSQAEFSRNVDDKTLEELRQPLIEQLQLLYRMEAALTPKNDT